MKEDSISFQVIYCKDICNEVKTVNPDLAHIINKINPDIMAL